VRVGPLYHVGDGPLGFDIDSNKDENFGGCPTTTRTGRVTVTEEVSRAEARLEVVQEGSSSPFQPPAACVVAPISYGVTTNGSLVSSDCFVNGARTKYFTFQGFSDQRIDITMLGGRRVSGGVQMPLIRVYGPSSGFIVGAGGNAVVDDPHISRRLFCGGTFTLEVRSTINSTFNPTGLGNFSLILVSQN
jgi:hypothetical protein